MNSSAMPSHGNPILRRYVRIIACFCLIPFCSITPQSYAASIPATVQAIRIPAENLAAILPGGLEMESIDPAVMRRIEKAVQLEKAFVEGKWEGRLSKTEATQIGPTEQWVTEPSGTRNIGMFGEVVIIESSPKGLSHSCKIFLGLHRKGTLADTKAPNFGERLAIRSKRVSGIFQLTEDTHTLLAALPQTLTDEDKHTLLFMITLGKPEATPSTNAPCNGLVTIETYRMPMDDWHRIPQAVRDDHQQLLEKCRTAAGKGKIERIDRISTCATGKDKVKLQCSSVVEMSYPTSRGISNQQMVPEHWQYRNAGSTLSGEREAGTNPSPTGIHYDIIPQLPEWSPTLKDGAAKDIAMSRFPVFGSVRFDGSVAAGKPSRTCLLGITPLTNAGNAPTQIALMFASVSTQGSPVPASPGSEIMVEVLVARGPSGAGAGDAEAHIKSLLARPGNIESIAAATAVIGRGSVLSSAMEWIYPMETLGGGDSIVIPNQFSCLKQGTELDVEFQAPAADAKISARLYLKHDLRRPLLPMATSHGTSRLNPEKPVIYQLKVNDNLTLSPGVWTAIKEIPLEPILGADDKAAKGQSCHVFARLITK